VVRCGVRWEDNMLRGREFPALIICDKKRTGFNYDLVCLNILT
jgi:hypothetical protein